MSHPIDSFQKLEYLLAHAPVILFAVDAKGIIQYSAGSALKGLGHVNNENVGKSIYDLNRDHPVVTDGFDRALKGESISFQIELGELMFDTKYAPTFDSEGKINGIIGISVDITSYARAERAAREASRLKSEFLANMSHEIRTPLNGVLGMIALLKDTTLNEEQQQYLKTAERSSTLLLSVVNDVLDLSKIESGKFELEKIRFDLNATLNDVRVTLGPFADSKRVEFKCNSVGSETILFGDSTRLQQVLINLVHNAIKFTPAQGSVSLTTEVRVSSTGNAILRFLVEDDGIGIQKEYLERLFQPFDQIDGSTTRKFGGTGLGLSICKRLTELMGGKIQVESELGVGTLFTVEIEMTRANKVRTSPREQSRTVNPAKSRRILVAEDQEINRMVIERVLLKLGHDVKLVGSGSEAVKACRESVYDLILMDCHMPEMDGFQATETIRAEMFSLNRAVPIFALTADVVKGIRERCHDAGMNGYLSKPLVVERLKSVLAKVRSRTRYFSIETLNRMNELNQPGLPDIRLELVSTFLEMLPSRLERLVQAMLSGDLEHVRKESHGLKSSAASIGALRISRLSAKMEHASGRGDVEEVARLWKSFPKAVTLTSEILSGYLGVHTSTAQAAMRASLAFKR